MMMRRGLRGRALIERRTSWLERKLVADKIESFPELWSHVRQIGHVLVRALMSVNVSTFRNTRPACLLLRCFAGDVRVGFETRVSKSAKGSPRMVRTDGRAGARGAVDASASKERRTRCPQASATSLVRPQLHIPAGPYPSTDRRLESNRQQID